MGSSNDGAKAAKSKRASVSEKGGLLNRMFGSSSPPKDETSGEELKRTTTEPMPQLNTSNDGAGSEPDTPTGRRSEEMVASPNSDKRSRRSSGIQKAKDMFSGARSAMSNSSPSREQRSSQTPIQKLGKTDPALSVPQGSLNNAAGESVPGPRSTFRVGVTEDKNKKCRRTMEDTHAYLYNFLSTPAPVLSQDHRNQLARVSTDASVASGTPVVESDNGYFAIFDGHAGTFAAEWCGKKLHLLLEETIRRNPNKAIPELLDETFTNVDQQLEKLPLKNSGCTAVTAVLRWEDRIPNSQSATGSTSIAPAAAAAASKEDPDASAVQADGAPPPVEAKIRENASRQRVLYTANVGDARIVLCRNGKALRLSYDHKGSDDNEGKRIANAGGLILNNRVNGVLAVTRALGDAYMKDLVTGHPYTTETVIQPDIDEFLILACDGLWDVCTDQEAVDLIRQTNDPQSASKQLVDHALARFSTDNLSCMVIRFDARAVAETIASRNEPIGVEGDAATKIRGGITESAAIVGQARRTMEGVADSGSDAGGSFSPTTGRASGDLSRLDSRMVQETEEEAQEQEPGPELDPKGLEKAREKAEVGQEKVQGLTPTTSQAQTLGSQSGGEGLAPTQSAPMQPTPPTQSQVASEGVREGPYMGGSGGS